MNENEIPILKKTYELYLAFHEYRKLVPKHDRHTTYERADRLILDIIENLFLAGYGKQANKGELLEQTSAKLNLLRLLVRLMKDTKTLDTKKYVVLQEIIDDTGRQLGGWSRSVR